MDIIGFTNYTINENGQIYNKKKKIIVNQSNTDVGDLYVSLVGDGRYRKSLMVHRLLYQMFKLKIGEIMPEFVIHHNGNKTDNSLENLIGATRSEKIRMHGTPSSNTSGSKNINITKCGGFQVAIKYGYKKVYYKTFETLVEAIEHRNIKLVELQGKFANMGYTKSI